MQTGFQPLQQGAVTHALRFRGHVAVGLLVAGSHRDGAGLREADALPVLLPLLAGRLHLLHNLQVRVVALRVAFIVYRHLCSRAWF